ncbi:TIGR01777 family oxidoreductase [Jatrophihabitans sp.]|uniref:TIGR01777 family oxidoreductase n=1 Tax=Jatrophihabitans sp. TaxID=1932789 RepID=UPI0030C746CB|nr:hypothetical protein [Jatrophihabitans sp.]
MRIVLAGASGLIGTALKRALREDGHEVAVLVRHDTSVRGEDSWDPAQGLVDPQFLAGADAVVCLSGVGVGDHRWSAEYKQQIIDSRVQTVGTLAQSLATYGGPRVLLAASAVGYYGDRGDETLTEDARPGTGFLADVCIQWEEAAAPAREAGVRVASLRTGLVLSAEGGLLQRLKPIVQCGVAGRLGSGRQFMPWITLRDELRAIQFLLTAEVSGPVNLTAPTPVRNVEFTKTLGTVLNRPTLLPTPGFALKLALGEFGGEALASQRAVPAKLLDAGFTFTDTDLEAALRASLGR